MIELMSRGEEISSLYIFVVDANQVLASPSKISTLRIEGRS